MNSLREIQIIPSLSETSPNLSGKSTSTGTLRGRASRIVLALALLAGCEAAHAQPWGTVDDVQAQGASVRAILADGAGNIFASGAIQDETSRYHAVIMKTSDGGVSWGTAADYPSVNDQSAPNGPAASFKCLAAAQVANGESHLVAGGYNRRARVLDPTGTYETGSFSPTWLIVRNRYNGVIWETLDDYKHPVYNNGVPEGIALDSIGNVYVVGSGTELKGTGTKTTTVRHWLIRKGTETPTGMVWETIGDFPYTASTRDKELLHPFATGVACVGSNVFVVGGGGGSWIVRKSSNGGLTWAVVDTFRFSTTDNSHAFSLAADSVGNIYVAGLGGQILQKASRPCWIVRKGTAGGTSWSTVDQFQYPNGSAQALGVAVDVNNNVHVTGTAWLGASSSYRHWLTRQRSALTGLWTTNDDFSLASNGYSEGRSITAAPLGNLFAAGVATDATSHGWVVRGKLALQSP